MKTNRTLAGWLLLLALLSTLNLQPSTFAQGTAFTYQGRLNANGSPANGIYDLKFTVCDALTNGGVVAGPMTNSATSVSNGLFTATLDFGSGVFNGPDRWLDVLVRTNGSGAFTELSPRQPVTATPYALYALTSAGLSGSEGTFDTLTANKLLISGGGVSWNVSADAEGLNFAQYTPGLKAANPRFLGELFLAFKIINGLYSMIVDANISTAKDISGNNISASGTLDVANRINATDIFANGFIQCNTSIGANGEIDSGADIYADGIVSAGGGISAWSNIWTSSNIIADGNIEARGGLSADGGIYTKGHLGTDQNLDVGGDLHVQGYIYGQFPTNDGGAMVVKNTLTSPGSPDILNRVVQLNISSWDSQRDAKDTVSHHISPQARDFNTAFGLGNSDKFISLVDEGGVALAAIQGLNEKVESGNQKAEIQIEALQAENAELKARLEKLEQLLETRTGGGK